MPPGPFRHGLGKRGAMVDFVAMPKPLPLDAPRALPAQPNNSLMVGIECLRQVVGADGPIGSREVARRMGMVHTRVNRLLGTLSYMGLLDQDGERRYRPGPGLHALAAQSMMASGLLPVALPWLRELSREGYTVALGTLWEGRVCFLFHERPGQSIEDAILRHEIWPADHSTIGVALLAAQGSRPLPAVATIGERGNLMPGQELDVTVAAARARGYAVLRFNDGSVSVGVSISSPPIAGLAVASRHLGEERIVEVADRLRDIADRIEREVRGASR